MFQIRKASLADIDLLRKLAQDIWMEYYPGIITVEQINYMLHMMYSQPVIEKEILGGVNWNILEEDHEPVGFLSFSEDDEKNIKLNKLYVLLGRHGKGIGQKALKFVVDYAEQNEFKNVYLTVNKKNLLAMKAYERNGFIRSEDVVNDIGNGYVMDDFVYTYSLGNK